MRRRTFEDVVDAVKVMTGGKPERCPDNISVTSRVVEALGLQDALMRLKYIHVAGTKGKGTTSAFTSQLLESRGYRVGLFTSPHLVDVRERMLINNVLIPKQTFADYFFEVHDRQMRLAEHESLFVREYSRANFFRFMFCLSLYAFDIEKVDVAVMEVGIGGRIDATNVIQPNACAITALGMDHMDLLGNTIEEIAAEKGGIIKKNVPCFCDPQRAYPSTRNVLQKISDKAGGPVIFVDDQLLPIRSWPKLAMGGAHIIDNAKLALCLSRFFAKVPIPLPLEEVESATLARATFAGRSQIMRRNAAFTYFLDGAHTPESITVAAAWFFPRPNTPTRVASPVGATKDVSAPAIVARNVLVFYTTRDEKSLLTRFLPHVSSIALVIFVAIENPKVSTTGEAPDGREIVSRSTEAWRELAGNVRCVTCTAPFKNVDELEVLVKKELGQAEAHTNILVTGSLYLVGEFLKMLGHGSESEDTAMARLDHSY